ncbi:DUF58 domain-containing protein [Eubacterium sp. ER2]|uniref:DUF58 domain-containing protein n=1 Tax=Eubacterium sp. ER2 TaxID=1519438 RepID=UPI00051C2F48|nr:DUF58 domain-containing protein [Eubacterium sp. ER2]
MVLRIILYAVAVVFTGYLFFILNDTVVTTVLILEILYPAAAWFFLAGAKRAVEARLGFVPDMGEKGQEIEVPVLVKSRYRFPVRCRVSLHAGSRFLPGRRQRVSCYLVPGRTRKLSVRIRAELSGRLEVELTGLVLWDWLGIFKRTVRAESLKAVGIWPDMELLPVEVTRRTREFLADADEYSEERSGDDPSQIYQIREYRPQDPARNIHWKISAKEDAVMVKENSFPLGTAVLVRIDFQKSRKMAEDLDHILGSAASLCFSLTEVKCVHMAAWPEEKNRRIVKRRVDSEESLYELLWSLMEMEPVSDRELADACWEEAFRGVWFSTVLTIDNGGDILVDGERQELLQV